MAAAGAYHQVHGVNPQTLVEKIVRERITESLFWKEECFGLTAETVIEKGAEIVAVGGVTTAFNRPTNFLCLILKLLQLQPQKEIIHEYILQEDFKYLRALGAFYLRLVGNGKDIYTLLEPVYCDHRKLRRQLPNGNYELTHMDEFIDELLHDERVCDIILPRLVKRRALEETEELQPYKSPLEDEDLDLDDDDDNNNDGDKEVAADAEPVVADQDASDQVEPTEEEKHASRRSRSPPRDRSRDRSRERRDRSRDRSRERRDRSRERRDRSREHRDRDRDRDQDQDRSRRDRDYRDRRRERSRSRSRDRNR